MQRILILVLFICGFVSAAFLDIDLKDSRLQTENYVYRPGGILGFAAEFGVFNEPKNMVDYTLAVGVSRFGYSHSDGDVSVSAWDFYVKPLVWSVTIKQIMFETYVGFGYVFSKNNFNPALVEDMENGPIQQQANFKYGYRLGYRITDQLQVSLVANYQVLICDWHANPGADDTMYTGGWGLNFQWNIPWIPF
ncbi:MAG: hypothetical protein SPL52_08950 [Fibrobacter sp.]|jgi:hypothetical protein|nr:hypothetical protein [Fibrobacter sp.]